MSADSQSPGAIPRHVAIIMDGNGRWAQARGLPRHAGHRAGVESVRQVVEVCLEKGVGVLTLFAFSSENWRRPKTEVSLLMDLFVSALQREAKRLKSNGVCLRIIGERSAFSEKLQRRIAESEDLTKDNDKLILQVAANYGGRWDVTQAARSIAHDVKKGLIAPENIDEQLMEQRLSFHDLPEPDFFIRTGGERRVSNFLLWHCAYSELYFTDTYWPDFDKDAMAHALADFAARQRRFGQTSEQVDHKTGN